MRPWLLRIMMRSLRRVRNYYVGGRPGSPDMRRCRAACFAVVHIRSSDDQVDSGSEIIDER